MHSERSRVTLAIVFALVALVANITLGWPRDDASYLEIRKGQVILESGFTTDDLGVMRPTHYAGLPLYSYIIAIIFGLFGMTGLHILASALLGFFVWSLYTVIHKCIGSTLATTTAVMGTTLTAPVWTLFIGKVSPLAMVLPLALLALDFFFSTKENKDKALYLLGTLIILLILHPLSLLVLVVLFIMLLGSIATESSEKKIRAEVLLVAILGGVWWHILTYKKLIMLLGANIFTQDMPDLLAADVFARIAMAVAILMIGPIFVVIGAFGLALAEWRVRSFVLPLAFIITGIGTNLLGLIEWKISLVLIIIGLSFPFAGAAHRIYAYLLRFNTRIAGNAGPLVLGILLLISAGTSAATFLRYDPNTALDDETYIALASLPGNAVVWTHPQEGASVLVRSGKSVMQVSSFAFDQKSAEVYDDYRKLVTTNSGLRALETAANYPATHIIVSPLARKETGTSLSGLESDDRCLQKIHESSARIYAITCSLEDSK